ncbi:LysM peptidoglycan-binding domain-containing protein, partial [Enterococcus faecalis]|uniref:LysM peptidoglycan-binding domain-containing protein n=1 Tax=Enterococcus faecalis TaxID=1351 RepID=UPI00403F4356
GWFRPVDRAPVRITAALAVLVALSAPGAAWAQAAIVAWSYQVQRGDTLASVAARMGVTPAALASANGLAPDAPLPPGARIALHVDALRVAGYLAQYAMAQGVTR